MKITKFVLLLGSSLIINQQVFAAITEQKLLVQEEENFRIRDNLAFVFRDASGKDVVLDFSETHDVLSAFEKENQQHKSSKKKANNLAVFGMSLVLQKGDQELTCVTLLPKNALINKREEKRAPSKDDRIVYLNIDSQTAGKTFISGLSSGNSLKSMLDLADSIEAEDYDPSSPASDMIAGDLGGGLYLSAEGFLRVVNQHSPSQALQFNGVLDFITTPFGSELKAKLAAFKRTYSAYESSLEKINKSFDEPLEEMEKRLKLASSDESSKTEKERIKKEIKTKKTERSKAISQQISKRADSFGALFQNVGWGASLFDSEQAIRMYFQSNIGNLITEALTAYSKITPEKEPLQKLSKDDKESAEMDKRTSLAHKKSGEEGKGEKKEFRSIVGLFLHIHSEMDMCAVCTASLDAFMRSFNQHFLRGEGKDHKIEGRSNCLLHRLTNSLSQYNSKAGHRNPEVLLDPNFRFRVTTSSRDPYVKQISLTLSRRNWAGRDILSLKRPAEEALDFHNDESYCAHKPYGTMVQTYYLPGPLKLTESPTIGLPFVEPLPAHTQTNIKTKIASSSSSSSAAADSSPSLPGGFGSRERGLSASGKDKRIWKPRTSLQSPSTSSATTSTTALSSVSSTSASSSVSMPSAFSASDMPPS